MVIFRFWHFKNMAKERYSWTHTCIFPCWGINCLVPFLQIIFLFCLNYGRTQQIFNGLWWITKIKRYFCSIKTIKHEVKSHKSSLRGQRDKPNMACKEVGKEFQYGQCLRMQRSHPDLTKLLEIALFLSVDMKELITDKKERNDWRDYERQNNIRASVCRLSEMQYICKNKKMHVSRTTAT